MTAFARVQREPDYPPLRWQKEGSVMVEQASSWRSTAPLWYPDVNCQRTAVFGGESRWQRGQTGNGALAEQSGREFQADVAIAGIRLYRSA